MNCLDGCCSRVRSNKTGLNIRKSWLPFIACPQLETNDVLPRERLIAGGEWCPCHACRSPALPEQWCLRTPRTLPVADICYCLEAGGSPLLVPGKVFATEEERPLTTPSKRTEYFSLKSCVLGVQQRSGCVLCCSSGLSFISGHFISDLGVYRMAFNEDSFHEAAPLRSVPSSSWFVFSNVFFVMRLIGSLLCPEVGFIRNWEFGE